MKFCLGGEVANVVTIDSISFSVCWLLSIAVDTVVSPTNLGCMGAGIESPASTDSVLGWVDTGEDSEFSTVDSVGRGRASPPRLAGVFSIVISDIATEDEFSVCAIVEGESLELCSVDTDEDSDVSTVNAVDSGGEFEGMLEVSVCTTGEGAAEAVKSVCDPVGSVSPEFNVVDTVSVCATVVGTLEFVVSD